MLAKKDRKWQINLIRISCDKSCVKWKRKKIFQIIDIKADAGIDDYVLGVSPEWLKEDGTKYWVNSFLKLMALCELAFIIIFVPGTQKICKATKKCFSLRSDKCMHKLKSCANHVPLENSWAFMCENCEWNNIMFELIRALRVTKGSCLRSHGFCLIRASFTYYVTLVWVISNSIVANLVALLFINCYRMLASHPLHPPLSLPQHPPPLITSQSLDPLWVLPNL